MFNLSSGLVAIASITFVIWTARRLGGDQVTIAVDDIGEAVAALIAAVSCAFAAWRAAGRLRLAWSFRSPPQRTSASWPPSL
jgi:hypothetical protein